MLRVVVAKYLDRAPEVLTLLEDRRDTVELTRVLAAVLEPLFDGAVLVPGVVAGQGLDGRHVGVVEDFVLLVQDGESLLGLLVLVEQVLGLGEEGGFFYDELVLLDHVGVARGEALQGSAFKLKGGVIIISKKRRK